MGRVFGPRFASPFTLASKKADGRKKRPENRRRTPREQATHPSGKPANEHRSSQLARNRAQAGAEPDGSAHSEPHRRAQRRLGHPARSDILLSRQATGPARGPGSTSGSTPG